MIARVELLVLAAGAAVFAALLLAAGWKLAHGSPEPPLVESLRDGRAGKLRFSSYSAQWSDFASGAFRRTPVEVRAELLLPAQVAGRTPAVVMLHGSDGPTPHYQRYAQSFLRRGLAVLLIDSFTTRGVGDTIGDHRAVAPYSMLIDAYHGLALLQSHPRVDADRIALVGWSKGGMVADWAARVRYRTMLAPDSPPFAAHAAFYPWCGEQHVPVQLTGAPLLFLVGERDDWTGAAPCADHVNRVREAGYAAKLVVYAGAEHAFDYAGRFRQYLGDAESWAACNYIAGDTHFRVVASGELLPWSRFAEYLRGCTSAGAHIGSNALAARQARHELDRFLLATLAGGAAR
jgi:dienelactone hydrolase